MEHREPTGTFRDSKLKSILILGCVYVLAIGVGMTALYLSPLESKLLSALLADVAATAFVFIFSRVFDNSSVYDPYWSVAPILLAPFLLPFGEDLLHPRLIITFALVVLWGARLTFNFLRHWRGLVQEDWRYADYRISAKGLYWPLSFFGFHLFPTLVVFAGCTPLFFAAPSSTPLGPMDYAAFIVILGAIIIEAVADAQMRAHTKNAEPKSPTFRSGLWAYSRHPNYFGEVSFWWGVFLLGVGGSAPWWTLLGPVGVTALFLFVSLPLIEKRMKKRRPDYREVIREVSCLIPWFPKRNST